MGVRRAVGADVGEMVRLAAIMFGSMGMAVDDLAWREQGASMLRKRLDDDAVGFVVDHPNVPARLVASAAGTVAQRLPTPVNPSGRVGYVQWVCTDEEFRARGLGRAVMRGLLDWFDAAEIASVELHSTPVAEAMYRELGFSDAGPIALRRRTW